MPPHPSIPVTHADAREIAGLGATHRGSRARKGPPRPPIDESVLLSADALRVLEILLADERAWHPDGLCAATGLGVRAVQCALLQLGISQRATRVGLDAFAAA